MKPLSRPARHSSATRPGNETLLVHAGAPTGVLAGPVNPPLYRFSTVCYDTVAEYQAAHDQRFDHLLYGRLGSPTTWALEDALCELEGAHDAVLTSSGLAAIQLALMANLKSGDHLLMTDAVYQPARNFCDTILSRFGITTDYYDPLIGANIEGLMRPNTRVVYVESPASNTFEVQDVPAIAAVAHARDAVVIADNTWATGLFFRSFDHGVDVTVHAGTKYIVGHSDAMVGVVLSNAKVAERIRQYWSDSGCAIGPDDAFLALRGLRTMALRLDRHGANALTIAQWLEGHHDIEQVLYPALASHPQHALWKRDFQGASGLLSIVPKARSEAAVNALVDALQWFGIGASWGGYESLALPAKPLRTVSARPWSGERSAVRLHIGLEQVNDLMADLDGALQQTRNIT